MRQLPVIDMSPQEKEEFRMQEASFKADVFANPRDLAHANVNRGEDSGQMTLQETVHRIMHTGVTNLDLLSEMYKFAEYFGLNNKLKI